MQQRGGHLSARSTRLTKRGPRWAQLVAVALSGLSLGGCSDNATDLSAETFVVASITVSPDTADIFSLGESTQLEATAEDGSGRLIREATFDWSSSDANVATVNPAGEVTGVGVGSATITATAQEVSASATVWVDPERVLRRYCARCHVNGHERTFETTTCPACHGMVWQEVEIHHAIESDHGAASDSFGLVGAHIQAACTSCHDFADGSVFFSPTGTTDCIACHDADYQQQHGAIGVPTLCLTCHTTDTWGGATFDHGDASGGFDLLGAHTGLACTSCHDALSGDPLFNPANESDCYECHSGDYQNRHAGSGYPRTCLTCHTMDRWDGATFDHGNATGFDLLGAHTGLVCTSCHDAVSGDPLFNPASGNDCYECHSGDYQDQHAESGYPQTCLTCHNRSRWSDATYDHGGVSGGFDLLGAHTGLSCTSCHDPLSGDPFFNPANENDCYECHSGDYQNRHAGSGYPQACLTCHNRSRWSDATFDHGNASGGFDLLGAHTGLVCTSCHDAESGDPLFNPANENDCYECHSGDYQNQHAGSGYPRTCLTCHTVNRWGGATFDHGNATGFDLLGAHTGLACTSCHDAVSGDPLFNPANENDCYECHSSDYQNQHAGSGYPQTCLTCHNRSRWTDATFDHDNQFFPIFSGEHKGKWNGHGCEICHENANDFSQFTCFNCHKHEKKKMDDKHEDVSGYVYQSSRCLACHPEGEE